MTTPATTMDDLPAEPTVYLCRSCGHEIIPGQLRRGDDWHADCWVKTNAVVENFQTGHARKGRKRTPRDEQDIKAPDGFTLGGLCTGVQRTRHGLRGLGFRRQIPRKIQGEECAWNRCSTTTPA